MVFHERINDGLRSMLREVREGVPGWVPRTPLGMLLDAAKAYRSLKETRIFLLEADVQRRPESFVSVLLNVHEKETQEVMEDWHNKAKEIGSEVARGLTAEIAKNVNAVVRLKKPRVVVETGVASGVSSSAILQALRDNDDGELYSIELKPYPFENYPSLRNREAGWIVPNRLRNRWHLLFGTSSQVLPELFRTLKKVDLFLHDSEHSYTNMVFEYTTAWPRLAEGGILLSDDVQCNSAFKHFSRGIRRKPVLFRGSEEMRVFGGLRK